MVIVGCLSCFINCMKKKEVYSQISKLRFCCFNNFRIDRMFTSFAVALPKTNMFTPEHMVAKGNETPSFLDKWPIFRGGCCWLHGGVITPWKFKIVSEIGPFFKRKFIFQPSFFRGKGFPFSGSCRAIRLPCHF